MNEMMSYLRLVFLASPYLLYNLVVPSLKAIKGSEKQINKDIYIAKGQAWVRIVRTNFKTWDPSKTYK